MSGVTKTEWDYWCETWDSAKYKPEVYHDVRTVLLCVEQLVRNEALFSYDQRQMIYRTVHVTIVNMWLELQQRRAHKCGLPDSINEALNSGDGVYRP